eukprot:59212_1
MAPLSITSWIEKSKTTLLNIVLYIVILSVLLNIILSLSADEIFIAPNPSVVSEPKQPDAKHSNMKDKNRSVNVTALPTFKPTNLQHTTIHNVTSNTLLPLSHIPQQKQLALHVILRNERQRFNNPHNCAFNGKVFVLGASKTGTTTMSTILSAYLGSLPLYVAPDDISWIFHSRPLYTDFIESLKKSRSFADSPWTFLYPLYDQLIPANHSKFILLLRDSTRDVVNSNMKMLARRDAPVQFDYTNHTQHPKGMYMKWETFWMITARQYELHNKNVIEYFTKRNRLKDLLVMNVAVESRKKRLSERWYKLTKFLQCDNVTDIAFPHNNMAGRRQMDFFPKNYTIHWQDFEFAEEMKGIWKVVKAMNGTYDEKNWNSLKEYYGNSFSFKH